ncbi:MAG: 2-oxoacid:acceptor oxidoreductase family protein [Nanoarchaeota archaeon]|nr:2-oxoacid:acceptor oxidoreductase family protein [Nanoarchaeota archaeon]
MIEIVIHGRAGQGAKSAGQLLAETSLKENKFFQTFPNYGPERSGAPMKAFFRISDKQIKTYSPVNHPNYILVIDDSLLKILSLERFNKDVMLLVNTKKSKEEIKHLTKFKGNIFILDATDIALDTIGKNKPNTAILGALIKISNLLKLENLIKSFEEKFGKKFNKNLIEQNITAIKKGYGFIK